MRALLLIGWMSLGACTATPWGLGMSADKATTDHGTKNGLVVMLGEEAFARASARLTNAIQKGWPDGMVIQGEVSFDGQTVGLSDLTLAYDEVWLDFGLIEVDGGSDSIGAKLSVKSPFVDIRIMDGDDEICAQTLSMHGLIDGRIALGQDKLGRVEGTMIDATMIGVEKTGETFGNCDYALGPVVFHDALQEVGQSIASSVSLELGPVLEQSLPAALGLNLAMDYLFTVGDNEGSYGLGWGHVRANPTPDESFWTYEDGRLAAPFAVAMDAEPAMCVPDYGTHEPESAALPPFGNREDTVLFVNADVATQALNVAWRTGLVCDDRLAVAAELNVDLVGDFWPALEKFGGASRLSVRLWPQEPPTFVIETLGEGAFLRVETGRLRMEIMVEYDDTWLRAATLEATVELEGPLLVDTEGSVYFDPIAIDVTTIESIDGLNRGPDPTVVDAIAETLVQFVVRDQPLLTLPPMATEAGLLSIELEGDYLSFSKVSD